MSGRMTGCHFTPSRSCSTNWPWQKSPMGTGRPWNSGPNYRCTTTSKLCNPWLVMWKWDMASMLFPAEDPAAFQRCGNCPCSSTWWPVGGQCGRVCRGTCHFWPSLLLRSLRVWAGHCRDVWWLQQLFLLGLPWKDSSSARLCKKKSALPTLPLSQSLEPLWWWLQGLFNKDYEKSCKITDLGIMCFKVLIFSIMYISDD